MDETYKVIKKVIDASSLEDAGDILYGPEGKDLSNQYYIDSIISSLIKKKDIIIKQDNLDSKKLTFDLVFVNDLWFCIFIAEHIRSEIDKIERELNAKRDEIDKESAELAERCRNPETRPSNREKNREKRRIGDKRKENNRKLRKLNQVKIRFFSLKENESAERAWKIGFNPEIDEYGYEDLTRAKEDIKAIHILRNAIQHGSAKNTVIIDNGFEINIPLEYIEAFNKGVVLVTKENNTIVNKANEIFDHVHLLFFDKMLEKTKSNESLNYIANPDYTNFLLEQVNYEYDELHKFNALIFVHESAVRYFVEHGMSLDYINQRKKIDDDLFWKNPEDTVMLYELGIDVVKLNNAGFKYIKNTLELHREGIDVSQLGELAFKYPYKTKYLFDNGIDVKNLNEGVHHCDTVIEFSKKGIDVTQLHKSAFKMPKETIRLFTLGIDVRNLNISYHQGIEKLHNAGIDVHRMKALSISVADGVIKLFKSGLDVYRLEYNDFIHSSAILKILEANKSLTNKIDIYKLSYKFSNAFVNPEKVIEMAKKGIDVNNLDFKSFEKPDETIKLYDAGIDVTKLPTRAITFADEIIKLYKAGVDVYYDYPAVNIYECTDSAIAFHNLGIDLHYLEEYVLENPALTYVFHNAGIDVSRINQEYYNYPQYAMTLIDEGIDISKLSSWALVYLNETIEMFHSGVNIYKLDKSAFKHSKKMIKMTQAGIDVTRINVRTMNAEDYDEVDEMINAFNLAKEKGFDMNKLPGRIKWSLKNINNIQKVLELTNYDYENLELYPMAFFTCDASKIEELYKTYHANILQSIFGVNNPKLIATLIYCGSVLKNYKSDERDYDIVDLDSLDVIRAGLIDTPRYIKNTARKSFSQRDYLKQFCVDEEGNLLTDEDNEKEIKKQILSRLRNAFAHNRFKPVKDDNGNTIVNKIYIYDKYPESNKTNFDMIIDIEELIEIIHGIERDLNKKSEEYEEEAEKSMTHI